MTNQFPPKITEDDPETLDEAYEAIRIHALPDPLQRVAIAHHLDQFEASPSFLESQAADFVTFCDALGIEAQRE